MKGQGQTYKFIISGGGTGGHIFPAIAIANALEEKFDNAEILFVGAKGRMEMKKIPALGYKIKGLPIAGLHRELTLKNLLLPFKVLLSLFESWRIIKNFKPHLAIGVGGYASGPLLLTATYANIPTLIQEQNSFAGKTNCWLSSRVDKICVAYKKMEKFFPLQKIILTGNPIRKEILQKLSTVSSTSKENKEALFSKFKMDSNKMTLLAFGGSLGARTINNSILKNIPYWVQQDIQILLQTGLNNYDLVLDEIAQIRKTTPLIDKVLFPVPFIDEMESAYSIAHIIVCRSGALSISELCFVGKPVVFIPAPYVTEDHQTHNALALVNENAALLIKDSDSIQELPKKIRLLCDDETLRNSLSENIRKLVKPSATKDILAEIEHLLEKKYNHASTR